MTARAVFFIPGLLFFGGLISYSDIRRRVIKNIHLCGLCLYGFLVYACLFFFAGEKIAIIPFLLNLCVSFSIAYLLYWKDLWSPGDAKLFVVLTFLTPPGDSLSVFNLSSLALFANIFLLALFFFLVFDIKKTVGNFKSMTGGWLKDRATQFAASYLFLVGFAWMIREALAFLGFKHSFLEMVLLYGLLYVLKRSLLLRPRYFTVLIILGLLLRFWMKGTSAFSFGVLDYLIRMLKFAAFFSILDIAISARPSPGASLAPKSSDVPFAPVMFLGAFCVHTSLLMNFLRFFAYLR